MIKIINVSGKAQHGKDTFCDLLKTELESKGKRCLRVAYADYLKFICSKYFGWDGNKGVDGRELLQRIGTDKVRDEYPNFWLDAVINLVTAFQNDFDYVLISDCRFENEAVGFTKSGFNNITVRVTRTDFESILTDEQKAHPSETALDDFDFNYYINAKNMDELKSAVDEFYRGAL
jgi:hypothetical protein